MRRWTFTNNYSGNPVAGLWGVIRFTLFLSVALHIGWSPLFLAALIVSYVELTFSS
jgi:hypothetical protein